MEKVLRRSADRKIAGVCGGLAEYFRIDKTLLRIIWLILVLCAGVGVVAYLVCWLLMPGSERL